MSSELLPGGDSTPGMLEEIGARFDRLDTEGSFVGKIRNFLVSRMTTISLCETDQNVVNFAKMYFPPCKDCKLLQHPRGPCSIALSIYASSTNIYVSRHGHRLIHPAAAANSRAYQPIPIYGLELAQIQRYLAESRGGEDRAESARATCTRSTTPWPSRSPSTVCSRLSAIQSVLRPGMLTKKEFPIGWSAAHGGDV